MDAPTKANQGGAEATRTNAVPSSEATGGGRDLLEKFRVKRGTQLTQGALEYRASVLAQAFKGRLPTAVELRNVTEELGVELATALFLKTLSDSNVHGPFAKRIRQLDLTKWDAKKARAADVEVAIVASNMFQSGRRWGDHVEEWRAWARELGFTTEIIETDPRRSVASNARVIFEFLARSPNRKRIIVTYGQGSAEFRYLLHRRVHRDPLEPIPEETENIRGWISVSGAFGGASSSLYYHEQRLRRLLFRLRMKVAGRNPVALAETSSNFPLWRRPLPPLENMSIASLVGVPYHHQVPGAHHVLYSELAKMSGPNDGVVNLTEQCAHPGWIVPVPGMSHRAQSNLLEPVFKRTLACVAREFGVGADLPIEGAERPTTEEFEIDTSGLELLLDEEGHEDLPSAKAETKDDAKRFGD